MATNMIIVSGETGGTNVNVNKVLPQHVVTSDLVINVKVNTSYELTSQTIIQEVLLPTDADSTAGDVFALIGTGAALFGISQAAGGKILFGINATTEGVVGSLYATQINSVLYLRKTIDPGVWVADGSVGNFVIDGTTLVNSINNTTSSTFGKWESETAFTVQVEPKKAYIANSAVGDQEFLLPPVVVSGGLGNGFAIKNDIANAFFIAQNAGQNIVGTGGWSTAVGTGGTLTAQDNKCTIALISLDDTRTTWSATSMSGLFEIDATGQLVNADGLVVSAGSIVDYGFVSMGSNTWTGRSFTFTSSYQEIAPTSATYTSFLTSNFSNPSNSRLTYTGTETRKFIVNAEMAINATDNYAMIIAVNGITQSASEYYMDGSKNISIVGFPVTLSTNDVVSIHMLRDGIAPRNVLALTLSVVGIT